MVKHGIKRKYVPRKCSKGCYRNNHKNPNRKYTKELRAQHENVHVSIRKVILTTSDGIHWYLEETQTKTGPKYSFPPNFLYPGSKRKYVNFQGTVKENTQEN